MPSILYFKKPFLVPAALLEYRYIVWLGNSELYFIYFRPVYAFVRLLEVYENLLNVSVVPVFESIGLIEKN